MFRSAHPRSGECRATMADAAEWNDEEVLDVEGVEGVIKGALSSTLANGDVAYDDEKADGLSSTVVDACLKGLQALGRPFKFCGARNACRAARAGRCITRNARRHDVPPPLNPQ